MENVADFIPTGISCAIFLLFMFYMRTTGKHFDDERSNNAHKWNTLIELQKAESELNAKNVVALIDSFNKHMETLISQHKSEKELLFKLHERNCASLEALSYKINQMKEI